MKKETIIRVVVLMILLINQILIITGVTDFVIEENDVYDIVSTIATTLMSLWTMWKNNSFTKNAQRADEYLKNLKSKEE